MLEQLAVSVILQKEGCYLLVERGRDPGRGQFAFPGGRVEQGETLEKAAQRELLEETGLFADDFSLAGEYHITSPHGRFHLHVYKAESFSGEALAGDDAASLGWYAPQEMLGLSMPQSMHDMLAKLMRGD